MKLTRRYSRTAAIVMVLLPIAIGICSYKLWQDTGSLPHVTVLIITGYLQTTLISFGVCWNLGETAHEDRQVADNIHKSLQKRLNDVTIEMRELMLENTQITQDNLGLKERLKVLEEKQQTNKAHMTSHSQVILKDILKQDKNQREAKRKKRKEKREEEEKEKGYYAREKDGDIVEVAEVIIDNDDLSW